MCLLTYIDLKIETLRGKEKQKPAENWRKRRRSSQDSEPEDAIVAGHQHHLLEADVQQDGWGPPQHHQLQGVEVASRLGGGEAKRSKMILNNTKNTKITLPEVCGEAADEEAEEVSPVHLPPAHPLPPTEPGPVTSHDEALHPPPPHQVTAVPTHTILPQVSLINTFTLPI